MLWDVFHQQGHGARTTISEFGPLLLTRMLALNETQAGVLNLGAEGVMLVAAVAGFAAAFATGALDKDLVRMLTRRRGKAAGTQE